MISWIFYHSINKGNPRLSYIFLIYWLLKGTLYSSLFNATLLSHHCIYLGFNTIVLAEEIVMCYGIWYNMKNAGQKVTSKNEKEAKEIAISCLTELGCQPEVYKDGSVGVSYQGENFHLEFGGRYVRIWDPMWAGIKGADPDMPKIKEAVNATNFNFGPTVVMTAPDEDGDIGLHSRRDIMLHPACPDNAIFLKAVLDSFFDTKEHVRRHYQQINSQQQQEKKPRRPVGFTMNINTTEEEQ